MLPGKGRFKLILFELMVGIGLILLILGVSMLHSPAVIEDEEVVFQTEEVSEGLNYPELTLAEEEITVIIKPGSSGLEIANMLEEKGVMSASDFHKLMVLFKIEDRLKAGKFVFSKDASPIEVLEKILVK